MKTGKILSSVKQDEKADFYSVLAADALCAICRDIGACLGIVAGVLSATVTRCQGLWVVLHGHGHGFTRCCAAQGGVMRGGWVVLLGRFAGVGRTDRRHGLGRLSGRAKCLRYDTTGLRLLRTAAQGKYQRAAQHARE